MCNFENDLKCMIADMINNVKEYISFASKFSGIFTNIAARSLTV
jgi:hypothetical protein